LDKRGKLKSHLTSLHSPFILFLFFDDYKNKQTNTTSQQQQQQRRQQTTTTTTMTASRTWRGTCAMAFVTMVAALFFIVEMPNVVTASPGSLPSTVTTLTFKKSPMSLTVVSDPTIDSLAIEGTEGGKTKNDLFTLTVQGKNQAMLVTFCCFSLVLFSKIDDCLLLE